MVKSSFLIPIFFFLLAAWSQQPCFAAQQSSADLQHVAGRGGAHGLRKRRLRRVKYQQPMPGSVNTPQDNATRGFPKLPAASLWGADVTVGWTSTNYFLRYFFIAYDVLYTAGEYKHGLWTWKVEGAELPFWWCEFGGRFNGTDGMADTPTVDVDGTQGPQSNMQKVWAVLDNAETQGKLGPLAIDAGLGRLATKIVRVETANTEAYLWKNRNTSTNPFLSQVTADEGEFEVYIFRAPYNDLFFNIKPCPPGTFVNNSADTKCALEHTFVAVVPSKGISDNTVGVETYGLAYGPGTKCPKCNGESCKCDALLIDISFSGSLLDTDPLKLFVPIYISPSKLAFDSFNLAKNVVRNLIKFARSNGQLPRFRWN